MAFPQRVGDHPVPVELTCPICGKTGTAIVRRGTAGMRTVSAPSGFYVTLTGSNSLYITCDTCKAHIFDAT